MSILSNVYNISESTSADIDSNFPLSESINVKFVFDIDKLTKLTNEDVTVLVNFGDPYSTTNEILKNTVLDCLVDHTFTYGGTYNIQLISNIDGVLYHINKKLFVYPSDKYLYTIPFDGSYLGYNEAVSATIHCFDKNAKIYYKIINEMSDFQLYDGVVSFTMDSDVKIIEYYCILSNGVQSWIHTTTFTQVKVWANPKGGSYTDLIYVTLTSNAPDAIIYYTLDGSDPNPNYADMIALALENNSNSILSTESNAFIIKEK